MQAASPDPSRANPVAVAGHGAIPESSESHTHPASANANVEGSRRDSIDAMWAELDANNEASTDDSDQEL